MNEFSSIETKEVKPQSAENYRNIKPEKEMTSKELNEAVNSEFKKAAEEKQEISEITKYLDDNGTKYRERDNLLPDMEFEVNGYKYKTDDQGRVISAEGQLQVKDHVRNNNAMESRAVVGRGDMQETDDRGHLIADRFNGSGGLENLVPMDSELNRHGDYKKMENTLADAMQNDAKVELKVEPIYDDDTPRPSEFRVTYTIDGEKEMTVFRNESEAKP